MHSLQCLINTFIMYYTCRLHIRVTKMSTNSSHKFFTVRCRIHLSSWYKCAPLQKLFAPIMAVSQLLLRKWKFSKDEPSSRSNYRQQLKAIIKKGFCLSRSFLELIEESVAQCSSKKRSADTYFVRKCPINIIFRPITKFLRKDCC